MSAEQPLISILICTYNRADRLRECLRSALAQTYESTEIVVVDDGSADHTAEVAAEFGDAIRYHPLARNQGIARARNEALALARGSLIAFQDDDDLMPPDRLDVLWQALAAHPGSVFSVGDLEVIDDRGCATGERWLPVTGSGDDRPRLLADGHRAVLWPTVPAVPHTTLFRRAAAERIGGFDQQFRYAAEDKDFFARLARLGPIVYVPRVVSWQRRGHESLTGNSARTEYGALGLYRKHLSIIAGDPAPDTALRERLFFRSAAALQRIRRRLAEGADDPATIPADYETEYLRSLPLRYRARVWWRTRVRQPLALWQRRLR